MKTLISVSVIILSLYSSHCLGQETDASPVSFSAYLETYYLYDFNAPMDGNRPGFVYSFNRTNEFNLNLGYVKATYLTDHVRANLALMAGTYANANLSAEPGVLKNVFEANTGFKLPSTKNLWIDAGIFASHIGFESAIGKDCWTLTRSILADNSPYYESGVKVSYTTDNEKWFLSGMVLNGWQRIQRVSGNTLPSFGTQLTYKPTSSATINYSTFIGTDKADSIRLMRYFHNLYGIFQVSDKVGITFGFDYGSEEKNPDGGGFNVWYSPVVMIRASLSNKVSMAIRGEYYADKNGVIIATGTPNGFQTAGFSINMDYQVAPNAVWRIEVRNFTSKDNIFSTEDNLVNNNNSVSTSLAIGF